MNLRSKSIRGFTLVELLVVIAIISILAAIIFPVFAKVREKARQTVCASNLRQLGLAFEEYSEDYDNNMPVGQPTSPGAPSLPQGMGWAGPLTTYIKNAGIFACPDDATPLFENTITPAHGSPTTYKLTPVSYAYNQNIALSTATGQGIGGSSSELDAPSNTVLLYEVTNIASSASFAAFCKGNTGCYNVADLSTTTEEGGIIGSGPGPNAVYSPCGVGIYTYTYYTSALAATGYTGGALQSAWFNNVNFTGPEGWHSGGANYLACDGHAKWLRGDAVSSGAYYNSLSVGLGLGYAATTSTSTEDEGIAPSDTVFYTRAAGTAASGWTLTFSPV